MSQAFRLYKLYLRYLARRRFPALASMSEYAPSIMAGAALWLALLLGVGFGLVILSDPSGWAEGDPPAAVQQLVGAAVVVALVSAFGRPRAKAVLARDGPGVSVARSAGWGAARMYLLETAWVTVTGTLVAVLASATALVVGVVQGVFSPAQALVAVVTVGSLIGAVALARQSLAYVSAWLSVAGSGRRGVVVAAAAGAGFGFMVGFGEFGWVGGAVEQIGAGLLLVTLGAAVGSTLQGVISSVLWVVFVVLLMAVNRMLAGRLSGATTAVPGRSRSRPIPEVALQAAVKARVLEFMRAPPAVVANLSVPAFVLAAIGVAMGVRVVAGRTMSDATGDMVLGLTPLVLVTILGRVLLPVTGADRFASDLRGIFQSAAARWSDQLWSGWLVHFVLQLLPGVLILWVVSMATGRGQLYGGVVVAYIGLAAVATTVSIATSILWPQTFGGPRAVVTNGRGFLTEYVTVGILAAAVGAVISTEPSSWLLALIGLAMLGAAWGGVLALQRRGIRLWQS